MFKCHNCGSFDVRVLHFQTEKFEKVAYNCICNDCHEYFHGKEFYEKIQDTLNVILHRHSILLSVRGLIEREENDQSELIHYVNNHDYSVKEEGVK